MKYQTIYYVTDGVFNYAECISEEDAKKSIDELSKQDKKIYNHWMTTLGYIPEGVKIPEGYYITTNKFD